MYRTVQYYYILYKSLESACSAVAAHSYKAHHAQLLAGVAALLKMRFKHQKPFWSDQFKEMFQNMACLRVYPLI